MDKRSLRFAEDEFDKVKRQLTSIQSEGHSAAVIDAALELLRFSLGEIVDTHKVYPTDATRVALRCMYVCCAGVPGSALNLDAALSTADSVAQWVECNG